MMLCPRCEGKGSVPGPDGITTVRCTWYDELWQDRRLNIPETLEEIPDRPTEDEFVHLLMEVMSKPIKDRRGGPHG